MAARVFLLRILLTVGLLTGRSCGLDLGIGFTKEPQDTVVGRNKPALLSCSSAEPNVTYTWRVDTKPHPRLLVSDSRVKIFPNGTLHFKKVLHKKSGHGVSDQGVYRCYIRNKKGTLFSRPANLTFASIAHDFSEHPKDTAVMTGDTTRFSCHIESIPEASIQWMQNSKPLPQNKRYILLNSGILLINNTEESDQGTYSCVGHNRILNKTRQSIKANLIVQNRTLIVSPLEMLKNGPNIMRVINLTSKTLECSANGYPAPEIYWAKLKKMMNNDTVYERISEITHGINLLRFDNVSDNHAGVYICNATQFDARYEKTVYITKNLTIDVVGPPKILKEPLSSDLPLARTARLNCTVAGYPPPIVTWYKDGVKLHINGRIKQIKDQLVLSNTVTTDSGVYECVASNYLGSAWAAGRILVNGSAKPAPSNVTCKTLSASEIQISWNHPPGVNVFYSVHYTPSDGGIEEQKVLHNETSTIIKNLVSYRSYIFYVRSYLMDSASDPSEEVVCRPGVGGVPIGTPNISVIAESPTTVRVSWHPLPPSLALGPVSEYKIQWKLQNHPSINVDTVSGNVTQYNIAGLYPNKTYEVRVLAANVNGFPTLPDDRLKWTLIRTSVKDLFGPVLPAPLLDLTAINSTTIQVRWSLFAGVRPIEAYILKYVKPTDQSNDVIYLKNHTREYIISGLKPQTKYEISLAGVSKGKEGEKGIGSIYTLPITGDNKRTLALYPPSNLEAVPTSSSSINLTWVPPQIPRKIYFLISYHVVSSAIVDDSTNSVLNSSSNGAEVSGLKPYTSYGFKVQTRDLNNAHSEYSYKVECRTLEDVPGPIGLYDIQWKATSLSSIQVKWKMPTKTNGVILQYNVSYSKVDDMPFDKWPSIAVQGDKLAVVVNDLQPNTKYFLIVRAITRAGIGAAPNMIPIIIHSSSGSEVPPHPPPVTIEDQILGIVLGCAIGGCCIILCMATLIYRRKCSKPGPHCHRGSLNGAATCYHSHMAPCTETHEMECLPRHLDSKGVNPNGQSNGLKLPLLSNGRIPNGHITKERNVRITENPQFNSPLADLSPGSCEGTRLASDEGDSLLSGHQETEADLEGEGSLNETQLTHVELSLTIDSSHADKHEAMLDDDGFHENETQKHHGILLGANG